MTPRGRWSDPATIGREDLEWWTSRGLGGERPDLSFRTVNQSAVKRTTCFFLKLAEVHVFENDETSKNVANSFSIIEDV